MSTKSLVERAYELARSGRFRTVNELKAQLTREHHDAVHEHLSGFSLAKDLRGEMAAARESTQADAEPSP